MIKKCKDFKAFIEDSNDMDDVYKNIEECNSDKERKIFIVFDLIADMHSNKKLNPIVTPFFCYTVVFCCSKKNIRINSTDIRTNESFNKLNLIIHQILVMQFL